MSPLSQSDQPAARVLQHTTPARQRDNERECVCVSEKGEKVKTVSIGRRSRKGEILIFALIHKQPLCGCGEQRVESKHLAGF